MAFPLPINKQIAKGHQHCMMNQGCVVDVEETITYSRDLGSIGKEYKN